MGMELKALKESKLTERREKEHGLAYATQAYSRIYTPTDITLYERRPYCQYATFSSQLRAISFCLSRTSDGQIINRDILILT